MLVLSRKEGERVLIGKNIVLTVLRISGGGVRIGLEAPEDIAIVRGGLSPLPEEGDSQPVREAA